ncbi:MAG: hypothetical protein WCO28_06060 [Bacteroidota bacterium]
MKKIILSLIVSFVFIGAKAQLNEHSENELHESFQQDKELKAAVLKFDLSLFINDKTNFIVDTIEKIVNAKDLNRLMKEYIPLPKNSQIRKASESNNGYTQTYGVYKGDDALTYVRFTFSQETGILQEVAVEKN